ncbi:MAG: hypothetical protein EA370_13525 [Wenzhouxiangella sp.]|nr:MAG: hypothetical protein EA370_13525 [Wenzhouxiangella sp.]
MSDFMASNRFLSTSSGAPTLLGALLLLIWGGLVWLLLMAGLLGVVFLLGLGLHAIHLVMDMGVSLGVLLVGGFLFIFILASLHAIWSAHSED